MSETAERKERFTPGPWSAGYGMLDGGYLGVWKKGCDTVVCRVSPIDLKTREDEWNAALIAAAPDMYAELDRVAKRPAEIIEMLRREGFVFDNLEDRWQKLAFSLYTAIVELGSESENLTASARGES